MSGAGFRLSRRLGLVGVVAALVCAVSPAVAAADTETIGFAGAPQAWTVPFGVHSVEFDLYGAAGTNNGNNGFTGGKGGRATKTFDVSPGQVVRIYVGGGGDFLAGGWNGGGHAFAGGGGGTDLRIGGTGLADRVLVAGGGGGVGNHGGASRGGDGGGLVGTSGTSPTAGAPGTQTAGGAGTWPGSLGQGGGGGGGGSGAATGGGGGGYYGGSTNDQEGGGGSGYGPAGTAFETGVRDGNGQAILTYTQIRHTLGVDVLGAGQGHVVSTPASIDCGFNGRINCSKDFGEATPVMLTATSEPGSIFTGWSGACSGSSATCSVNMTEAREVEASFEPTRTLSVTKSGTGAGSLSSNPVGIDCGPSCSDDDADFELGSLVTLTAAPDTGSNFYFWSGGGCSGTSPTCTVTMSQARSVTATFTVDELALTVVKQGGGTGAVASSPTGISCGTTCNADYAHGTPVTLTASPGGNSQFGGWSGDGCSGTSATCTVTIDQARSIEVTFTLQKRTLTVSKTGNGSGLVSSGPAGIDCGSACAADFDIGSSVTLVPDAAPGSDFDGWSGACTGSGAACLVTINQARSVEAEFSLEKRTLSVTKSGNGAGTVTSSPEMIECGADCTGEYDFGSSVTLSVTPAANSNFEGWQGACAGSGTDCTVTMDQARTAQASFTLRKHQLAVTRSGAGSGTVTSLPTGIACGSDCGTSYDDGTTVVLIADPAAGSTFTAWGGACSGAAILCTVTMTEALSVSAAFTSIPPGTTITRSPKKTMRTKTKRTKVRFAFRSDQPGSTFECRFDRRPFAACSSPLQLKVKTGRHTFQVRAVNGAGVADPTPAKYRFRVLKKR